MADPLVPPAASEKLVPVSPKERIALLDVLRGFCLFGVLWSNLNDWYAVLDPVTPSDHAIRWTQDWLVESRFYSLLGFLFGVGFAIQLTRSAQRGQDVRNLFLRRMAALLGFGIVHATLIWHGDILASYALAGFALVLFRRSSPRTLLLAMAALWLLFPYVVVHVAGLLGIQLPSYDSTWRQLNEHAVQVYAHGSWTQVVATSARQFRAWLVRSLLLGGASSFLALFLLGLWAVRVDLIARLTRRRGTFCEHYSVRWFAGQGSSTCSSISFNGGQPILWVRLRLGGICAFGGRRVGLYCPSSGLPQRGPVRPPMRCCLRWPCRSRRPPGDCNLWRRSAA